MNDHLPALTCLTYIYDTHESSIKKKQEKNIFQTIKIFLVNMKLIFMKLYAYYHKHLNEISHIINP